MTIQNGYATVADVKLVAESIAARGTAIDAVIERDIETASRAIDAYCRRRFWTNGTAEVRVYAPVSSDYLDVDDLASSTFTLKTTDAEDRTYVTTWGTADYQTLPLNGQRGGASWPIERILAADSLSFTVSSLPTVQITGTFGFGTAVPVDVTEATILKTLRLLKRHESPTGVQGGEYGPVYISRKTDPDIADMLDKYRKGSSVGVR